MTTIRDMERLEQYMERDGENGPYVLEFEHNGDHLATCARTRSEAVARTDEKCGGKAWILNYFGTQSEWKESICNV